MDNVNVHAKLGRSKDRIGETYGRLTIVAFAGRLHKSSVIIWKCRCDCGREKLVRWSSLKRGATRSCGCLNDEVRRKKGENLTHAHTGTSIYATWNQIVQRCTNPNSHAYHNYGGRGISVCEKWMAFAGFLEDMGERPHGLTIELLDNNGPYCKENCVWADRHTQARNKRNNRLLTFQGRTQTLRQWALELEMDVVTLFSRIVRRKWPVNRALTEPLHINKRNKRAKCPGR